LVLEKSNLCDYASKPIFPYHSLFVEHLLYYLFWLVILDLELIWWHQTPQSTWIFDVPLARINATQCLRAHHLALSIRTHQYSDHLFALKRPRGIVLAAPIT
jgi:hypothetical protein